MSFIAQRVTTTVVVLTCMVVSASNFCVAQESGSSASDAASAVAAVAQESTDVETKALHDKLAKYLSGTKWTGQFTLTGEKETKVEHYEIISAEKGEIGDYWNLVARIKYGGKDKTVPLPPIEIKFAGKTPVITLDNAFVPGFGNFDARVLIRKGKYAGTWAHSGGVGGHLFGTIERMDEEEIEKKKASIKGAKRVRDADSDSGGGDKE